MNLVKICLSFGAIFLRKILPNLKKKEQNSFFTRQILNFFDKFIEFLGNIAWGFFSKKAWTHYIVIFSPTFLLTKAR